MKKNSSCQPESQKNSQAAPIRLALESCLLFDGAALATAKYAIQDSFAQKTPPRDTAAQYTDFHFDSLGLDNTPNPLPKALTKPPATQEINQAKVSDNSRSNTLIVVDSRSSEGVSLLANPPEASRVLALDSGQNGFQQVAKALRGDALTDDAHIVFRGEPGGNQEHSLSCVNVMTSAESSGMRDVPLLDSNDATEPTVSTNSVVFIDASVPDLDTLLDAVPATAEIVYLNNDHDGLNQIAQHLVGESRIDNIQLITHGRDGELHLGSSVLNSDSLLNDDVKNQLVQIGQSLTANGGILVYGCNIAQTAKGQQFVSALAELTGADVAVSNDATGAANRGDDWVLETEVGSITSPIIDAPTGDGLLVPLAISATSAPLATDASIMVTEDMPVPQNLMDYTTDPDGDTLSVLAAAMDTNGDGQPDPLVLGMATPIINEWGIPIGEITVNRNGSMNFEPAPNYNGPVPVLTYTVVDPSGATDTGTLDFGRVAPVNDVPLVTDASIMVTEDTPARQNLMDYATNPDGNTLSVLAAAMDTNGDGQSDSLVLGMATPIINEWGIPIGEITVNRNGSMNFEPAPNYNGSLPVLTYTVVDPSGATDTGTLDFGRVAPVNDAPIATDASIMVSEDTPARQNLMDYATDPDGDTLTVLAAAMDTIENGRPDPLVLSVATPTTLQQETGSLINLSNQGQDTPQVGSAFGFTPNGLPPHYVSLWENDWFKPVHFSRGDDLHLTGMLKNQLVVEKKPFNFGIPSNTFKHDSPTEKLEYRATRADGSPLPNWLKFNCKTQVFYGVSPKGALSVEVLVTVNDSVGKEVSAAFKVAIHRHRLHTGNKPGAMV